MSAGKLRLLATKHCTNRIGRHGCNLGPHLEHDPGILRAHKMISGDGHEKNEIL